jgi:hypothetical protein
VCALGGWELTSRGRLRGVAVRALGGWELTGRGRLRSAAVRALGGWELTGRGRLRGAAVRALGEERRNGAEMEPGGGRLTAGRSQNGAWRRMPDCWEEPKWSLEEDAVGGRPVGRLGEWELLS